MMSKCLITGANGNIGKHVVLELLKQNKNVKAAVYNTDKANSLFKEEKNVEIVKFDFLDKSMFKSALSDTKAVFLVRPPNLANPKKDMFPFLKAVKKSKVEKIVFISLLGVDKNYFVPHRKIEKEIKNLDVDYVFLRPSFFMQNLNTNHIEEIKNRSELFIPAGKSKTSFIDTRDIAKAAAFCLVENKYNNTSITLTGKEAIDYYEVSNILSKVLKRDIIYKNPSLLRFRKERIKRNTPKAFANVMTLLYLMTKLNTASKTTNDLEKIIRQKPISFKQYAIDYKDCWK